jgi:hypothetical protein
MNMETTNGAAITPKVGVDEVISPEKCGVRLEAKAGMQFSPKHYG